MNGELVATLPIGDSLVIMVTSRLDRVHGSSWPKRLLFGPDSSLAVGKPAKAETRSKGKVLLGRRLRFADRVTMTIARDGSPAPLVRNEPTESWLALSGDVDTQRSIGQCVGFCFLYIGLDNCRDSVATSINFRQFRRGESGVNVYSGDHRVRSLVVDFTPRLASYSGARTDREAR